MMLASMRKHICLTVMMVMVVPMREPICLTKEPHSRPKQVVEEDGGGKGEQGELDALLVPTASASLAATRLCKVSSFP